MADEFKVRPILDQDIKHREENLDKASVPILLFLKLLRFPRNRNCFIYINFID